MIFLSEHSPSIPAKVLMSIGVLAGTITATALTTGYSDWLMNVTNFEEVEGNVYRQVVMFICCLIYFVKNKRIATRPSSQHGRPLPKAGVIALFAGPSGTGKTLAAEVLANELKHPVYRVDMSHVVSKYIGETEKNLQRVFDTAIKAGAILLFDEADALFGKRSEVNDGHDRYANQEVSYLFQRMEAFQGLSILTSNMETKIEPAFLKRIHFLIKISR